jgi:chaperone LolA
VERAFFDAGGKPAVDSDGIFRMKSRYDDQHRVIEIVVFGIDGKPSVDRSGAHKTVFAYDNRGNIITHAYFGLDDKPVYDENGVHMTKKSFDRLGNKTETTLIERDQTATFKEEIAVAAAFRRQSGTEARFTQRFTPKGSKYTYLERGNVVFGDPPRMRWTYSQPVAKEFVFNGETVWLYSPADHQVTIWHVTEAARASLPLASLADGVITAKQYTIFELERGATTTTLLTAKDHAVAIPSITVVRDTKDGMIRGVEYSDRGGNRTSYEFASYHAVPTPAARFVFIVPKDATVLESPR